MNDARTRKIRAGSDLRQDVLYMYKYIDKFHSKIIYVGLAPIIFKSDIISHWKCACP